MIKEKIYNLFLLFFIGSFIGWIWEVLENFIVNGAYANRGFMHGPWLPIYGVGILLIYFMGRRFDENPVILFGVNCIAFGIVEYTASWFMEQFYHARWWDYTYEFMNLQGRICLKYVILFSAAGCLAYYYLLPPLRHLIGRIPQHGKKIIVIVVTIIFVIDGICSIIWPNTGNHIAESVMKYLGYSVRFK